MTHYTVVWATEVQDELLEFWLAGGSVERRSLTEVANQIDRELAIMPEQRGRPVLDEIGVRSQTLHVLGLAVTVYYNVESDDRLVRVLRISLR